MNSECVVDREHPAETLRTQAWGRLSVTCVVFGGCFLGEPAGKGHGGAPLPALSEGMRKPRLMERPWLRLQLGFGWGQEACTMCLLIHRGGSTESAVESSPGQRVTERTPPPMPHSRTGTLYGCYQVIVPSGFRTLAPGPLLASSPPGTVPSTPFLDMQGQASLAFVLGPAGH